MQEFLFIFKVFDTRRIGDKIADTLEQNDSEMMMRR